MKTNYTILTPFYNTHQPYFEFYVNSMSKLNNVDILIGDDGSSIKSKQMLRSMTKHLPNVKIIEFPENRGMCRVLKDLAQEAKTPYVIKIDSDDGLVRPPITDQAHPDAILLKRTTPDPIRYLSWGGMGPTGTAYKKEVFLELYKDAEYMDKMEPWIYEDVFMHLNLIYGNYNLTTDIGDGPVFERYTNAYKPHTMTANKALELRAPKCETFLIWCLHYNKSATFYHDVIRKVREYNKKK
jgi:glycosyltransferase involved in cell wall biosynthesis